MKIDELKALFESSVLDEGTKDVLTEAFQSAVEAEKVKLEEAFNADLKKATQELSEEAVKMVEEAVSDELESLSEEIAHARTLEVQYAEKLELFKESYSEKSDELVRTLVAESVAEEVEELREDIELAKKTKFAVALVEEFKDTYEKLFGGVDVDVATELKEAKEELNQIKRTQKLNELLESVTGSKRKVAETVLESVALDKLEERFESIKGMLLAESKKEDESLEEGKTVEGTIVMEEQAQADKQAPLTESQKIALQRVQNSLKSFKR